MLKLKYLITLKQSEELAPHTYIPTPGNPTIIITSQSDFRGGGEIAGTFEAAGI